jgi:O-antigen ligase
VLICWGNAIAEMMINKEPLSYFFRWRHMNHQLTAVIGMHAGYLALFIAFSVAIIIYKYKGLNRTYRLLANLVLLLFSLFLFSLMARAVLGFFILSALLYFLIKGKWKLILAFVIVILSFGFIATQVDDQYNYLLDKTVYQLPLIGKKGDKTQRFERLGATKYMFLEHPIIGVGNSDSKQFRQKYYLETGDKKAYKNQFNAHNQFFEFLDEYGLIGALIYIAFFVEVIILSWKKRDYLFLYLSLLFLVANLTESMLQRTHGIVFCAIFFSLFLSKYSHKGLSSNKVINN